MITHAGLLVLVKGKILLVREKYDLVGHNLSIPKGAIEKGESYLDAAIREAFEETGLNITKNKIDPQPYICNFRDKRFNRSIIYFICKLESEPVVKIKNTDEITWVGFTEYREALNKMQLSQISMLLHIEPNKIPERLLNYLLDQGILKREKHPYATLYIYDYTDKCKTLSFWNELTLWCRGLIADEYNTIKYRPLRKFFEKEQVYTGFIPEHRSYIATEKIDGAFGLLYHVNGRPFICTRSSFVSGPAINGTAILYNKYHRSIGSLNPDYSYFLEIVYPGFRNIVDYGTTSDLFILGAYDNKTNIDIPIHHITLPFKKPKMEPTLSIEEIECMDKMNHEGYVILYDNYYRLKLKFQSYKNLYHEKYARNKV